MRDNITVNQSIIATIALSAFILFALFASFYIWLLLDNDDLFITTSERSPYIKEQQSIRVPTDNHDISNSNLTTDSVFK